LKDRLEALYRKWSLALSVAPVVIIVAILKTVYHIYGFEVLAISPFMSGLIAANVFLLGFLISSVLLDYKESERLPGDLAASLMAIFDEISALYKGKKSAALKECLAHTLELTLSLKQWFYKVEHTDSLMDKLSSLNDYLAALVAETSDTGAVGRIKQEQNAIRKNLIRIRTIRGTFFIPSGYAIAEAMNIVVIMGLLLTQIDVIYEALFFVGIIAFVNTYMLVLIKQLDNPFDYYSKSRGVDEVSLMPLDEVIRRIEPIVKNPK
jgi:hypothetical protein